MLEFCYCLEMEFFGLGLNIEPKEEFFTILKLYLYSKYLCVWLMLIMY